MTETLEKLLECFIRTRTVVYKKSGITKTTNTEGIQLTVLLMVEIQRVFKVNEMHPYHVQFMHELSDYDYGKRIMFCGLTKNSTKKKRVWIIYRRINFSEK